MEADRIIATLQRHRRELNEQGVAHIALFGSVARGEARPDSDLDLLIDLGPQSHLSVFDYVGLKEYIAGLFDFPVDVVNREGLKPHIKATALGKVMHAF